MVHHWNPFSNRVEYRALSCIRYRSLYDVESRALLTEDRSLLTEDRALLTEYCNTLQHAAIHCNTLRCNMLHNAAIGSTQ